MDKKTEITHRRAFIKKCGLSTLPLLIPTAAMGAPNEWELEDLNDSTKAVNFVSDGLSFSPGQYLKKLNEIQEQMPISPDYYGNGGATRALEEKFTQLTGKEKAIYLPTGTLANQLAIKLLSGQNTKVIVPENSHVFRDEADAAQSVHRKRLLPVGKGKSYFDVNDLKAAISYTNQGEVFKSGLNTVVLENPVRRADGVQIPMETLKEIYAFCKSKNYSLHLDAARIHLAMATNSHTLADYAAQCDTMYISLYKYLNAAGGAILCGDAELIDQIPHQIKIHGGTLFQSWANTAMALHYLNGIEDRWTKVTKNAKQLISNLNTIEGVTIDSIAQGTNIYDMRLAGNIDIKKLSNYLYKEYRISFRRPNEEGIVKFVINESLQHNSVNALTSAWKKGIAWAKS
ncbi:threonine aldolase family protein [Spongiimicrobium salis]|uniref:threonine aldolase family protein n=1 Tax=Spongiimicrobium salis TaxID=1667022 RepID=UPI00374DCB1E